VLTTSPPPSVHLAGKRISQNTGLPWIADLRDLWSDDRNSLAPGWRRRIDRRLERKTLAAASALVTVSKPLAGELEKLHPGLPIHVILNGYDPAETGLASELTPRFTLTHTGTFYQGRRDPTMLFRAVARLLSGGEIPRHRIRIRLFARHEPWVGELAETHGLADVVELLPWGPRRDALRAQQASQVLLLLHWGGERERGVFTGKVFEYLAARRPILMIGGGEGVLHDLIEETGAGVHVTDQSSLERALLDLWREFEANGEVAWRGREELLGRYSHRRMAREFAALLDGVCGR
jgi:glycosyltransferase involved in cell wall biosynthesis